MKIADARVLLTGATGGIGQAIATHLAAQGACLLLSGRRERELEQMATGLRESGARVAIAPADLGDGGALSNLAEIAGGWQGGVNVVVHNAGINVSGLLESIDTTAIADVMAANVVAPIQLTRLLLPGLLERSEAQLLFMGSGFGTLGYPGFSIYSASKFALRGFAEALRREVADTNLSVSLLAPRAVDTPINDARVRGLQGALKMAVDPPARIAAAVAGLIEKPRAECQVGWPERMFMRVNRFAPSLVDGSLRRQLPEIRAHLKP
ncbi:SDR family oxidoreductase [Salinisphaera sp. T31B1]|uniref:SDR family oxidoreductase n=1 Tax=Salinisphaera sp. T31B1 TaxID=727963 RepID=UPI00333F81F1